MNGIWITPAFQQNKIAILTKEAIILLCQKVPEMP